jgi:hypothetical protein
MVLTPISTKVVGVSFIEGYPQNIFKLSQSFANGDALVTLERDKDNQYDQNAIRVVVDGEMVGHIPALLAKTMAKEIDSGKVWLAELESILVSTENIDNPGIKIIVWRQNEVA